ncbi:MAG: hypothetical protein AB1631_33760 [Acidobacteriota bacterium]
MKETDKVDALLRVLLVFDKMNIPYVIGGSFASSIHGMPRSTNDADVLALMNLKQASAFAAELQDEFYADEQAIRQAVKTKRSFNVIHLESMFKIDVFVAKQSGFEAVQLERRQLEVLKPDPQRTAYVATPEDTILAKLVWYRKGNEISDKQWQDVLGVIRMQVGHLDLEYLRRWAAELGVADLLARAME